MTDQLLARCSSGRQSARVPDAFAPTSALRWPVFLDAKMGGLRAVLAGIKVLLDSFGAWAGRVSSTLRWGGRRSKVPDGVGLDWFGVMLRHFCERTAVAVRSRTGLSGCA